MWRQAVVYGAALALGAAFLQWIELQRLARLHGEAISFGLLALAFLGLGVFVGARLFRRAEAPPLDGNPAAQAALGVSERELDVLRALAEGLSNKEIARALSVSPNTVKSHVQRLYQKLGVTRRTAAVARARALRLLT